jgi:hypothetical protein
MFLDILSERGYAVSYVRDVRSLPLRVDLKTGEVFFKEELSHKFKIGFPRSVIRSSSVLH